MYNNLIHTKIHQTEIGFLTLPAGSSSMAAALIHSEKQKQKVTNDALSCSLVHVRIFTLRCNLR